MVGGRVIAERLPPELPHGLVVHRDLLLLLLLIRLRVSLLVLLLRHRVAHREVLLLMGKQASLGITLREGGICIVRSHPSESNDLYQDQNRAGHQPPTPRGTSCEGSSPGRE